MLIQITPDEFLSKKCELVLARDHHYTGPLEAQSSFGAGGAIHHGEGEILASYANRWGGHVLEIGSDHGVSTRYIHQGLDESRQPAGLIVAVDFDHKWNDDDQWSRRRRHTQNSFRVMPPDVLRYLPEGSTFKWAFIDGEHSFEASARDTLLCLAMGIPAIFYHDTTPNAPPFNRETGMGANVRDMLLAGFRDDPDWTLYDISTFCGMMFLESR